MRYTFNQTRYKAIVTQKGNAFYKSNALLLSTAYDFDPRPTLPRIRSAWIAQVY